ncbi:unnamed protein product [Blepharisma stoltei]|uniref:Uncharacterized protein n=1 Tax=Blepharisma stoltei TaxID=1481888 RepID=A0AAU9JCH3_9CILI|nr:unnamed protein product [Blepharisma stoltei]
MEEDNSLSPLKRQRTELECAIVQENKMCKLSPASSESYSEYRTPPEFPSDEKKIKLSPKEENETDVGDEMEIHHEDPKNSDSTEILTSQNKLADETHTPTEIMGEMSDIADLKDVPKQEETTIIIDGHIIKVTLNKP